MKSTMMLPPRKIMAFLLLLNVVIETCSASTKEVQKPSVIIQSEAWKEFERKNLSPFEIIRANRYDGNVDANDWTILMPRTSSEEWEYFYASNRMIKPSPTTNSLEKLPASKQQIGDKIQQQQSMSSPYQKERKDFFPTGIWNNALLRQLFEDFNFKGCGISFYKSFLYLKSLGIALRIPLFSNWDWWDRRPALPSVNLMVCAYYPLSFSICLSSSFHVESVKWAFLQCLEKIRNFLSFVVYHFVRSQYLLASLTLYPFLQKWLEPPPLSAFVQQSITKTKAHYKKDIQERLGMSMWYRWSLLKGFETRVSYWHMYLPTLRCYQEALPFLKLHKWLEAHFASLGVDTSIPNPMPPHVFCTAILSLSGFYLPKHKSKATTEPTPIAPRRSLVELQLLPTVPLSASILQESTAASSPQMVPIARGGHIVLADGTKNH